MRRWMVFGDQWIEFVLRWVLPHWSHQTQQFFCWDCATAVLMITIVFMLLVLVTVYPTQSNSIAMKNLFARATQVLTAAFSVCSCRLSENSQKKFKAAAFAKWVGEVVCQRGAGRWAGGQVGRTGHHRLWISYILPSHPIIFFCLSNTCGWFFSSKEVWRLVILVGLCHWVNQVNFLWVCEDLLEYPPPSPPALPLQKSVLGLIVLLP